MSTYRVTFNDLVCTHNVWIVVAKTEAEAVRKCAQQHSMGWNFRVQEMSQ